ncbi:MAG: hypothetical protein GXO43_04910 [Crenarchaeota archaeon]|nr:hypothetical protein [Thermoproteota archaeon]
MQGRVGATSQLAMMLVLYGLSVVMVLALTRATMPQLYVVAITMLSLVLGFALLRRSKLWFLCSLVIAYLVISLSWSLAYGFSTLPRDDVYHYYPFTKYVYVTGHFTYAGKEKLLERIFFDIIVPWPAWHILVVSISKIMGLNLFYSYQVSQMLTTSLLTILVPIALVRCLARDLNNDYSRIAYLIASILPFVSFVVFSNTNPVSRSFAIALYLLILYLLVKSIAGSLVPSAVAMFIVLLCVDFTHPYWCLALPTMLLLSCMLMMLVVKLMRCYRSNYVYLLGRKLAILSFVTLASSVVWILYFTWGARASLINAIERLAEMRWSNILGLKIAEPWLKTEAVQAMFFKVYPLEHVVYWMVWITDLIPIALALAGFIIMVLSMIKGRRVGIRCFSVLALLLSSLVIAILTGASSSGLVTRYAIPLVYIAMMLFLIALAPEMRRTSALRSLFRKRCVIWVLAIAILSLYVITAALSLGTRTYQASFIWSGSITLEDKGMHAAFVQPLMSFCNRYCIYQQFSYLLCDDSIVRVFLPLNVFMNFTLKTASLYGGAMSPISFTMLANHNISNALILSVRNFKPLYWDLRSLTWLHIDIVKLFEKSKEIIRIDGDMLYNNGRDKVLFIP